VLLVLLLSACAPSSFVGFTMVRPDDDTGDPVDPVDPVEDGTAEHPFVIPVQDGWAHYTDSRDTTEAPSDQMDVYPPFDHLDESGPEYFYTFEVDGPVQVRASLAYPEPAGVDNDIHLLTSTDPSSVLDRAHYAFTSHVEAGTYFLVVDTYVADGVPLVGPYALEVTIHPLADGTVDDPIPLAPGPLPLPYLFTDTADTRDSTSSDIDAYPPFSADESGPEVLYEFEVDRRVRFHAEVIAPEPDLVDIDVHVLDRLNPARAVDRDDIWVGVVLEPGTYWIALDTYGGDGNAGEYTLMVQARADSIDEDDYFNDYILDAVDFLDANYGRLGYDSAVLTHDIEYGSFGFIPRTGGARTMCVAAVMEVILTAIQLYAEDHGDAVFDFLPRSSWEGFGSDDIKAHLWVSYALETSGSADALRHFGMGENIPFEQLRPGSFVGINRTTGSGHAVVFLGFVDIDGNVSDTWHSDVVGFTYFSSQGGYAVGSGGLDFRYAIFSDYGAPEMPYKRDLNVIYSEEQWLFNTGMMFEPSQWRTTPYATGARRAVQEDLAWFDESYFTGVTADDDR
jgi:hypothetical protein